jgi:hypothetical protein
MQTAFFIEDELDGMITTSSVYDIDPNTNNSARNMSDPRPRVAWIAGKSDPLLADTRFEVDNNNRYIDIEDTSGNTETLSIPRGHYTGPSLAAAIEAELVASTYASAWVAGYNVTIGKFQIFDPSMLSAQIKILWKTGPNGSDNGRTSLAGELGWVNPGVAAEDTSFSMDHSSIYSRWNTFTYAVFKMDDAKNLRAWLCEVGNAELGVIDPTIDISNIHIFGAAGNMGALFNWQTSAPVSLTYSPGPSFSENQIRLGLYNSGAASTQTTWMFSWRHQDSHKTHIVKLCKAFERTWSDTGRTLTTLKKQGLLNTGQSLGIDNYYPVPRLRRWVAPLAFDAWPASEYRDVVQEVVHHGRQNGVLWALRWDDIASGVVNAEDEADKGFLLWATLQDYSRDTYVGESADFISGEISLEQLR